MSRPIYEKDIFIHKETCILFGSTPHIRVLETLGNSPDHVCPMDELMKIFLSGDFSSVRLEIIVNEDCLVSFPFPSSSIQFNASDIYPREKTIRSFTKLFC
jgi:hypothetical protein